MSTLMNLLLIWVDAALIILCLLHLGIIYPYIPSDDD